MWGVYIYHSFSEAWHLALIDSYSSVTLTEIVIFATNNVLLDTLTFNTTEIVIAAKGI